MTTNLATVYCQHGDERFGALIAACLTNYSHKTILGNPKAFIKNKRFIESDLNRSYSNNKTVTYESERAQQILAELEAYDTVLDIHTSRANVGKLAILPRTDKKLLTLAVSLGFNKAVIMPKDIVKNSLIGTVNVGISLEFGSNSDQSLESAKKMAQRIHQLDDQNYSGSIDVYYAQSLIDSKYRNSGLRNYQYSTKIRGYPVLVGETQYKDYAGFFADRVETVIIGTEDV